MGRVECPIVKYVLITTVSRVGVRVRKEVAGNPMVMADELGAAILRSGGDAIIAADAGGVILFWNPGAERIFGFTAAEAIGQSLDLIIPEALRERHWHGYHEVMRTGQSRYGQGDLLAVPGMRKDRKRISLEFTVVPLRAKDGTLQGMGAIMRDVTARFEELRSLRQRAAGKAG
jgi:PAS domain S-box-containing protein